MAVALTGTRAETTGTSEAMAAAPHVLVHKEGDLVGVAVQDVAAGRIRVVYMDSDREVEVEALEEIPLGHKLALADVEAGAAVIEYGVRIGIATEPIGRGRLVHVHNLRSARWPASG
jgi:(2R)-sulfolactate sulfo-lyase subunit alpha